jgi:hypothetical protein
MVLSELSFIDIKDTTKAEKRKISAYMYSLPKKWLPSINHPIILIKMKCSNS